MKAKQNTKLEEKAYSYLRAAGTEGHVVEEATNE